MFIEVEDNNSFDYFESEVQRILTDNINNYSASSWARKIFSNGSGGYYIPVPSNLRFVQGIEELIEGYPQYPTLPSIIPPNTFTPINVTDSITYSTADVSSLGEFTKAATLTESNIIIRNNGDRNLLLTYRNGNIVILNLENNTYHFYDTGFYKPWKPMYLSATDEVIWMCATSPDLVKISLVSNSITYQTIVGSTITNSIAGIQSRVIGTDNNVYFGTNADAKIYKYNIITNVITYLGQLSTLSNTYIYWIGADSSYTYSILRNSGNYWLCITNNSTLVNTYYYSNTDLFKNGNIILYQDGINLFWYATLQTSALHSNFSIKLENGTIVTYPLTTSLLSQMNGQIDYNNIPNNFPTIFSIDYIDYDSAGIKGNCAIQYKFTSDFSYITSYFPEVIKESMDISTMCPTSDGNLIGVYAIYNPVFKLNTSTDTISQINQFSTVSSYALFDFDGTQYYIGGYTNQTNKWLFSNSWDNGITNPNKIPINQTNALYHYFYGKSGEYLYIAQQITRNDYGSTIAMYIPSTDTIIQADNNQINILKNYSISHMFLINSGDKLVLIGSPTGSAFYPRIFIWDISTEKNINNVTPITIDLNLTGLTGGYGISNTNNIFFGICGNVIYKVDITATPTITYKNLPGVMQTSSYWNRSVGQKADGTILLLCPSSTNSYIYEVDTSSFSLIRKSSNMGQFAYLRKFIITSGDKMYLFNGNTSIIMNGGNYSKYFIEKINL